MALRDAMVAQVSRSTVAAGFALTLLADRACGSYVRKTLWLRVEDRPSTYRPRAGCGPLIGQGFHRRRGMVWEGLFLLALQKPDSWPLRVAGHQVPRQAIAT